MRILSFGQMMNLDGGLAFTHQMVVELPTGERRVINTDEGTVQQLIAIMAGLPDGVPVMAAPDAPVQQMPVRREQVDPDLAVAPDPEEYEEGVDVFGGDPGEVGRLVDADSPPVPDIGGIGFAQPQQQLQVVNPPRVLPNGKVVAPRAKTVPKDEMGYPIVPKRQASRPQQSAFSEEEDGTQI